MVTETETKISGCSWERRVTTVPLPTAVGPETTVRRAERHEARGGVDRSENSAIRAAV